MTRPDQWMHGYVTQQELIDTWPEQDDDALYGPEIDRYLDYERD